MKKIMPLATSIAIILIAGIFASAGTMAWFSDTETAYDNLVKAGTLDLKVGGSDFVDDPNVVHVTLTNMKPGDGVGTAEHYTIQYQWILKNVGSLDGEVYIEIKNLIDYENGRTEPEKANDGTGGNPGPGNGELSQFLKMHINAPGGAGFIYLVGSCDHTLAYWANAGRLGPWSLPANSQIDPLVLEIALPEDVGNVVQSDSVEFDIEFYLEQA